jgi:hypothetical protein
MSIKVDKPQAGAILWGPASGAWIDVSGTTSVSGGLPGTAEINSVGVQLGSGGTFEDAQLEGDERSSTRAWSYRGLATTKGSLTITIVADGSVDLPPHGEEWEAVSASKSVAVTVSFDTSPPQLTISSPSSMANIAGSEAGFSVPLKVTAQDNRGVQGVAWRLDSSPAYTPATREPSDGLWQANVSVPPMPLGNHSITVRGTDIFGNTAEQAVTFVTIDTTPPASEIIEPKENAKILGVGAGATVKLLGTAKDLQTGVKSVEWSLDGVQFSQTSTTDNWASWSADVPITDYGFYAVSVRLTDQAGNSTTVIRNFEVVSSYKPQDTEQLLSTRAYLDSLLAFARDHVRTASGAPLSTEDLNQVFHQPFGKLKEPLSELGNLPVNRLRVCIEVLREYLKLRPKPLVAHWKCDEGEGTTLSDASTYGNHGTLVDASRTPMWAPGKFGSALNFDAGGSHVQIPHTTSLELGKDNAEFSVAFWMYLRPEGAVGQWRTIMNKGARNLQRTPALWVHPNNNRVHYRISTTSNWNEGADSVAEIDESTWTHIAYVKNGSRLKLYIDGRLDSEVTLAGASVGNDQPLSLGMGGGFGGIDGSLDDIRIYDLALSETSVRALADGNGAEVPDVAHATESEYRLRAYETILAKIGASYEEIRLARGAAREARIALAERLGIRLDATHPDQLDKLLPPSTFDESWMERMFGLADTNRSLLQPPAPRPELLEWQERHLKELWISQDHPAQPGAQPQPPVIDPDQIDEGDLTDPVPGNPAYDLWQIRDTWVTGEYATLKQKREAQATPPIAGFKAVVDYALGSGTDLPALEAEYEAGESIDTKLRALHLTMQTFTCLLRTRALAQAGTVTDGEWADVYGILAQVRKSQQYETWRTLEQQKQIALTPEYFKISDATKQVPPWRASMQARREWQDTLQARIDQKQDLENALRASVSAAEEIALPVLRDALVATIVGPDIADQVADQLTEWLLIDVKDGGSQTTTRILQAIETIQAVMFSLRTGRFDEGHPADQWDVVGGEEGATTAAKEKNFDDEWKWMGSYATWRAAMLVFLYPENMLLPGLREQNNQPLEFKTLIDDLRKNSRLTATEAREKAKAYLDSLRARLGGQTQFQWLGTITLTEQLSEQELVARGDLIKGLWADSNNVPVLKELFYLVPMQLALQLQKSGEYVAALDWYQTVYAYNLPLEKRKVYYGLRLEQNTAPVLEKGPHWLRKLLNPHSIAETRPNAYTRYTLMCLVRCFLEFGDSEFTRDTGESIARARSLYTTARDLLTLPDLELRTPADPSQVLLPNPVLEALRLRAEMQLAKLRQGRNIAGMKRTVEIPAPSQTAGIQISRDGEIRMPAVLRPTPYYYRVLMDRSKQLANLAQQIEATYLSALGQLSAEQYRRFEADNALNLADAGVELQALRVAEAQEGETLAQKQKARSDFLSGEYYRLINAGRNEYEENMIAAYWESRTYRDVIAGIDAAIGATQFTMQTAGLEAITSFGAKVGVAAAGSAAHVGKAITTGFLNYAEASIQANSLYASQERREEEWRLQKGVADQDSLIAAQQLLMAQDRTAVVRQEAKIASTQAAQAKATVDFLDNQFLNAEMYEWISGILGSVYRYFLQQATATAMLAENQLAFERQQIPPSFIQTDYWVVPSVDGGSAAPDAKEKDRGGLTGSARLLQDIYQLDQHAFESDKRKLNLAQTFSLARLAPLEFQQFRETGVLPFQTPMQLFDQGFPGHYLRLIKHVRTSVVALIPPTQGIRATLTADGISRVVIGGDVFQETIVRRDPEMVALTSPTSATGVFELDTQSEMLLPFEAMGVHTSWEFRMPKAANPFDYSTIADVLITLEYTALNDFNYRQQVVQELNQRSSFSGQRSFSFRHQFVDAWYDLHNPEQVEPQNQMVARFETGSGDFPANVESPTIRHILIYIALSGRRPFADLLAKLAEKQLKVGLYFTPREDPAQNGSAVQPVGGEASSQDGRFSTLAGNAVSWKNSIATGKVTPDGEWKVALPNTEAMKKCFEDGEIEDILFIITYSGRIPEWPV